MLESASEMIAVVGEHAFARSVVSALQEVLLACVDAFHLAHPLEPGMPIQAVRIELEVGADLAEFAMSEAVNGGGLAVVSGQMMRPGWSARLSDGEARLAETIVARLATAGAEPPSVEELAAETRDDVLPILRYLERNGTIIQVEPNRYYTDTELKSLVSRLREVMRGGAELGPPEIREALGLSRKFLIPFLEYCDRVGHTNRRLNGRVWSGS
jgi:selenocysteine-specific elongation factor